MAEFRSIRPEEITDNPFTLIGKDWMLVTSAKNDGPLVCGEDYNTMTASWGGVGILWSKPVAFVFIRPQRHTFGFAEENNNLTLSFFDETHRAALAHCGKASGRDGDKVKACGLTPIADSDADGRFVRFEEARMVLKTKKLYHQLLDEKSFTDSAPLSNYAAGDFHMMYVCEIKEVLVRE